MDSPREYNQNSLSMTQSKIASNHRNNLEWERNVLQKTIGKLASELEEQTDEGKHLMECIKGEEDMIQILKKVIDETEVMISANRTGHVPPSTDNVKSSAIKSFKCRG
ncbi:hypothetical protein GCK72_006055 [Caenorhabditis remanei]|uniref:Uncharacterized protein n=1 Tax=Caenorhabditis remanei TaxID=31234 RepID=A0A6A5HFS9_CAERE|nr:hypothetical protein GCK72_006055 [Caenorhabditis remanei]KAF1766099.1 hypothetical protein GCK72_006055 [Caenorhabditis remanei]